MALKTNFEATSDVASPFVDEIANPGDLNAQGLAQDREKLRQTSARARIQAGAGSRNTDSIARVQMLTKRIKERQIAQQLRDERDN
jgi:hypothetical protein